MNYRTEYQCVTFDIDYSVDRDGEYDQFDSAMERGDLDDKYADYLMFKTDALIGNGEMLLAAMESGRYYEGFKDSYLGEKK